MADGDDVVEADDGEVEVQPRRTFAEYLALHNGGEESVEAGALMEELVRAVATLGKQGTLTLTLTVKPGDETGAPLEASVAVAMKKPTPKPFPQELYPDGRGRVSVQASVFEAVEATAPVMEPPADDAELLLQAASLVVATQFASVALLQRKLGVGSQEAGWAMGVLQDARVVSVIDEGGRQEVLLPSWTTGPELAARLAREVPEVAGKAAGGEVLEFSAGRR